MHTLTYLNMMNDENISLEELAENFSTQIEQNNLDLQRTKEATDRLYINDLLISFEKDFRNAYKGYQRYVCIGPCDLKTDFFNRLSDSRYLEAIRTIKGQTKFKFFAIKTKRLCFDFWNYQPVYRILAVPDVDALVEYSRSNKVRIKIIKEF